MIGGWAFNLHVRPRMTGDIDFLLSITSENEARVRKVLSEFGFSSTLPPESEKLLIENKVLMMGVEPTRIDLLTTISGVSFEEVWSSRLEALIDGVKISIISKEMLLKNKIASGRLKDLADVEQLEKV